MCSSNIPPTTRPGQVHFLKAWEHRRLRACASLTSTATTFHVPVEMPLLSTNRGHIGTSDAPLHLSSADSGPAKTRKESGRLLSASLVRRSERWIIRGANDSPESIGKNEKSIWEHYNEMAAVEDNIREVEWRDLADTILVFVCSSTLFDTSLLIWL